MSKMIRLGVVLMVLLGMVVHAQDDTEMVAIGTSINGFVSDDSPSYTVGFEGEIGDVIYIVALDDRIPVEFTLMSPNGGLLALSNENLISNIELGSTGQYTIEFMRPEWSSDEGEFTAYLGYYTLETLTEDEWGTPFYAGELDDIGALQQLTVPFEAGELVTMQTYGANLALSVQAPNNEFLIYEGVYNDPMVPLYQFPMTGDYLLTLQTTEPEGTSAELYIFRHEVTTLATNETASGELEEGLPAVFAFESPADKMWDINGVIPLNGDVFMAVYQFGERPFWESRIAQDEGSGPNGQPRISPFIPTVEDTYYIALWYDDWNTEYESYPYEMTVSPSTLLSLPNNSPITGSINNETGNAQYAYRGKAGDSIIVSFRKLSESGALALTILSAEDEVITFTGRNAVASRFEVVLPLDGFYQFVIRDASYEEASTLDYEIMIEPLTK